MAIKRYIADLDTTIANAYQSDLQTRATGANAGAADVLETFSVYGRENSGSAELSRILIRFPVTDISTDRTNGVLPASGSVSYYLRLYNAKHSKTVPESYTLSVQAVSQSWQEGTGLDLETYADLTKGNAGSNWMSASSTTYWTDKAGTLLAGGSYHTGSSDTETFLFTQTFSSGLEDLELDITPLVEQWIAGTYTNYGVGIHMSASYEAYESGSSTATSRQPGQLALDADDSTQSVIYNPSGSTTSYYTKRFFARGSQYFFKRPCIEARWNDSIKDDRGNFYYSSSLATASDNLNTIYLYNYVRGDLTDIPDLGADKHIYVSLFSGSVGGFYSGGDGDDVAPSDIPVSGTTSANTGSVQVLSVDNKTYGVNSNNQLVATGGIVSTGIYSASIAFTGSVKLDSVYDVWYTGSHSTTSAFDAVTQFFTGTIKPMTLQADQSSRHSRYVLNVTNLKQSYLPTQTARFNVFVRNKYWNPTIYTKAVAFPPSDTILSASYRVFRTLDAYNAIPYGTGSDLQTMMSYDKSGNYFDLDMRLLESGYEYALKVSFYDSQLSGWVEQDDVFKFRVEDYEY